MGLKNFDTNQTVDTFRPLTHLLALGANQIKGKSLGGKLSQHLVYVFSYPTDLIDTVGRMAIYPAFALINPLYRIGINLKNGEYTEAFGNFVFCPVRLLVGIAKIIVYDISCVPRLVLGILGISTIYRIFRGKKTTHAILLKQEYRIKKHQIDSNPKIFNLCPKAGEHKVFWSKHGKKIKASHLAKWKAEHYFQTSIKKQIFHKIFNDARKKSDDLLKYAAVFKN